MALFAQLVEQDPLLLAILESFFDAIYITDGLGNTLYANSAYERISGISRDQVIGKHVQNIVSEGLISRSIVMLVLAQKKPVTITQQYVTGKTALTTANPILDDDGQIRFVVCNIRDISELQALKDELQAARELSATYMHVLQKIQSVNEADDIVAESPPMRDALELAGRVALYDTTVLISGESGTGKEVVAEYLHQCSPRKLKPFLKINTASLPANLLEAELFGYAKGAFTGALSQGKPGFFELANGGTILLDEISELPLELQAKLLRVLQNKEMYRVGGQEPIQLSVRVLATTNRNLPREVESGHFRQDLFYRLNVFPLTVPPLRKRKEDIPPLVSHFLRKLKLQYGRAKGVEPEVLEAFQAYDWPGNVRELENLLEYLFVVTKANNIQLHDLPGQFAKQLRGSPDSSKPLRQGRNQYEAQLIADLLGQGLSLRKIAARLGVNPSTILRKIRKYNLK